jgi:hypothetical protein
MLKSSVGCELAGAMRLNVRGSLRAEATSVPPRTGVRGVDDPVVPLVDSGADGVDPHRRVRSAGMSKTATMRIVSSARACRFTCWPPGQ